MNASNTATRVVDEAEAYRLAEAHNMPPLEVDAAFHGESVWIWLSRYWTG